MPLAGDVVARSSDQAPDPSGVTSYVAPLTTTLSISPVLSAAPVPDVPAIVGTVELVVRAVTVGASGAVVSITMS